MAKIADKFEEIMYNLQNGQYKPIYVLHGEEPYYIDQISNYIEENALREDERGFNQIVMYGADTNAAAIADQARQFPMMAERQVIIVKEAQAIKKWDQLEHYLDNPSPTSVIVICHKNGKVDGRKKVFTKAAKVGVVYESKKKYDNELPMFISQYMNATDCPYCNAHFNKRCKNHYHIYFDVPQDKPCAFGCDSSQCSEE